MIRRFVVALTIVVGVASVSTAHAQLVVSEVFTGEGPDPSYRRDYVEVLNRGTTPIDVTGWTVGYKPSADEPWQVTPLAGVVGAGRYYLIGLAPSSSFGTFEIPAPDANGSLNLQLNGSVGLFDAASIMVDVVGYGLTPPHYEGAPFSGYFGGGSTSLGRKLDGCYDTNDNSKDFRTGSATPRTSADPAIECGPIPPPCDFTFSPNPIQINPVGGSPIVYLTTLEVCEWQATNPEPWLQIGPASGVGSAVSTLSALPNRTGATRTANITIGTGTLSVIQESGSPCTYSFNTSTIAIGPEGATGRAVTIQTDAFCEWTTSVSAPWITITQGAGGSSPAVVPLLTFDVPPLAKGQRTGTITITGGAVLTIVQTTDDLDGDDLNDAWEVTFGLDATSADGPNGRDGDPDGDGKTNFEEQQAGTHPRGSFTRYLAEGATGSFLDTMLALVAPDGPARVLLRYLKDDGTTASQALNVPARTRRTVYPADLDGMASASFATVIESDARVVVDRVLSWDRTGYGSHAEAAIESPARTWYLAEGTTSDDFRLFYLLQNSGDTAAEVEIQYLLPFGRLPVTKSYTLPRGSRTTIEVNGEDPALAGTDVSATITSNVPIIVERAMYLNRPGQIFAAGHASAGVTSPSPQWFLAEGATGPFFDTFVLVANPNPSPISFTAQYLLLDGAKLEKSYDVPAHGRFTNWLDGEELPAGSGVRPLANVAVSTIITATQPVVVERAMWWPGAEITPNFWYEAHNSAGVTGTSLRWALADGVVGEGIARGAGPLHAYETYILIANPSASPGEARVTLMFEDGATVQRVFSLSATSRTNVAVASDFAIAGYKRFSALVESIGAQPVPLVVERAIYTTMFGGPPWTAGSNAVATPLP